MPPPTRSRARCPRVATLPERPLLARQAAPGGRGRAARADGGAAPRVPVGSRADGDARSSRTPSRRPTRSPTPCARPGSRPKLLDELGDLLFQTTFLALLCEEAGGRPLGGRRARRDRQAAPPPSLGVRRARARETAGRRPQPLGGRQGRERGPRGHLPRRAALRCPALLEARKMQRRAAAIGFEYATLGGRVRRSRERARRAAGRAARPPEPEPEREPLAARRRRDRRRAVRVRQRRPQAQLRPGARAARRQRPLPRARRARRAPRGCRGRRLPRRRGRRSRSTTIRRPSVLSGKASDSDRIRARAPDPRLARQPDRRGRRRRPTPARCGRAAVPSGASTGSHEAVERRDGGAAYGGKAVEGAVASVNDELAAALIGRDVHDQRGVDRAAVRGRRDAQQGPRRGKRRARRVAGRRQGLRPPRSGCRSGARSAGRRRTCCRCR